MAQFITVTSPAGDTVRLNVDAIEHYVRPGGETSTQILLTSGGVLRVKQGIAEIDQLIRDNKPS